MTAPFRVLMVCTGNICRSPLAERMLAHDLDLRSATWGPAWRNGAAIVVSSAGTAAELGQPMTAQTARLADEYGADPAGHVARQLTADMVAGSDLVLTLTRDHRRQVVSLHPRATRYTFALTEFARVLQHLSTDDAEGRDALGPLDRAQSPSELLPPLVEQLSLRRGLAPPPDDPSVDDVVDPYRRSDEVYASTGRHIADSLTTALQALDRLLGCPAC